jgi:hypothetical protein
MRSASSRLDKYSDVFDDSLFRRDCRRERGNEEQDAGNAIQRGRAVSRRTAERDLVSDARRVRHADASQLLTRCTGTRTLKVRLDHGVPFLETESSPEFDSGFGLAVLYKVADGAPTVTFDYAPGSSH